jgi:tight adherence protein C
VFNVPWIVPLLFAGATICGLYSYKLNRETTAFDRGRRGASWKQEIINAVRKAANNPLVATIVGPPDMRELIAAAGHPRGLTVDNVDLLRAAAILLAVTGAVLGVFGGHVLLLILVLLIKAPEWVLLYLARKRTKRMARDFIPVAARLAGALSAGMETTKALEWASQGQSALNTELKYALDRARTGASLAQALQDIADRTGLLDARRLATSVMQAQRHGVPVADTLMDAVRDARERRKNEVAGKAKIAEQKMQLAVLIMAMPTVICTLASLLISLSGQMGGAGF